MAHKMLSSWSPDKQQTYRETHPDHCQTFHMVLDESPSMAGTHATQLRSAFNMYLAFLQRHADPMSLVDVRTFATDLRRSQLTPLGQLKPLTTQTYDPLGGSGTALYRAVGETCMTATRTGCHILIVFTDGYDNTSDKFEWTAPGVCTLLKTLQHDHDWLCLFLGAFVGALAIGKDMGFARGNCLVFSTDQIPEAFQTLVRATQKYLTAGPQARKLLAAGGIF